jgi:hypothetical protein
MPIGNPNGYGSVAFSPGGGGIGPRRPGVAFHSPVNAGARMTPDKARRAQQSAVSSLQSKPGYGTSNRTFSAGPTRRPPKPSPRGPMSPTGSGSSTPPGTSAPPPKNPKGSGGILRGLQNMSSRNKLMMGGGALVLGAAAYSGRRGDGTSSGRSGMTRY